LCRPGIRKRYVVDLVCTGVFDEICQEELDIFTADCLATAKLDLCPATVAEELMPSNTTALFISSLTSNMIWMALVIVGIAVVGAYYLRTHKDYLFSVLFCNYFCD
jgi:hypothetical protein